MMRGDGRAGDRIRLVAPAALLGIAIVADLLVREALGRVSSAAASTLLDYLRLAAETGVWVGAAWLGHRLLGAAVQSYSARSTLAGGGLLLIGGGSRLLTDVGSAIIFAGALLGIVANVFRWPLGGLLATSGV